MLVPALIARKVESFRISMSRKSRLSGKLELISNHSAAPIFNKKTRPDVPDIIIKSSEASAPRKEKSPKLISF